MPNQRTLEICVQTLRHAIAAQRGGAQRVELCGDLPSGGVTPSTEFMQSVRRELSIPIHVLIRPRSGNFFYSDDELEVMRNGIQAAKQFGIDGVVLGVLRANRRIDVEKTSSLAALAHPLPVTFHRAFDLSDNFDESLEDVIQSGAMRILTAGGMLTASESLPTLARLVQIAGERIVLMPGGGINSANLAQVAQTTLASEFHTSAGTSQMKFADPLGTLSEHESEIFEKKVAELADLLRSLPQQTP